jgi:hypothetical protein
MMGVLIFDSSTPVTIVQALLVIMKQVMMTIVFK